jgi:hypothetical protein
VEHVVVVGVPQRGLVKHKEKPKTLRIPIVEVGT